MQTIDSLHFDGRTVPTPCNLTENTLHIWAWQLGVDDTSFSTLRQLLAPDEQIRAERYRFDKDRRAYIIGRARLRQMLAGYLSCAAEAIDFSYGQHGKPMVNGIEFNLSHSHDWMMLVVTKVGCVGIDVEWIDRTVVTDQLAKHCFSPREWAQFNSLPIEAKQMAFFYGWTCKEAFIKAVGSGAQFGLKKFSVELAPTEPARLLEINAEAHIVSDWHLCRLVLADQHYCSAVAWQGEDKQLLFNPCLSYT